jgi:hypothetical protein
MLTGPKSSTHTVIQAHTAAATHTTTRNDPHARQHGRNTQRRRGTPAHDRKQQPERTQHLQHSAAVAVGSYTTAVEQYDCNMHDHRTRVALVRSTDCQRLPPPPPPTTHAQHRTTHPLRCGGNARVYAAQRDAQTQTINPTQRCAVSKQRRTRDNTKPQSQNCSSAPDSLRSRQRRPCTPKTRIVPRAYDAAKTLHVFAGPTHIAALPATITPTTMRTHAPPRAHAPKNARYYKPHAARRHVSVMARVTQHSAHLTSHTRHIAHSHAAYRHTSPARPHDVPHSRNNCALRSDHRMHTAARTPRTARRTAPTTPHAAHRKSHPVTHAAHSR